MPTPDIFPERRRIKLLRPANIVLGLLCLMYFIIYIDRVNISTSVAGFAQEFQLSPTEIGLLFSTFAYPYLLCQIIGGWVSDRFGTRKTLIVCSLIWTSATLLAGLAGSFAALMAARFLLGLGEGATFPAATSVMARWVPVKNRGFAQSITHACARVGNAATPALIVAVMSSYGWRASFFVCAAISLIWLGAWLLITHESPNDDPRITPEELKALPPPHAKKVMVPWMPLFRRMMPVIFVYFCYGWTLWLFLSWVPQYFLHSYNLDLKESALFASSVFFAGVLGSLLGGIITDAICRRTGDLRYARSLMVAICMFLSFLSLIPLMFGHELYVSFTCLSAGFFFAELTVGPLWTIPMDIAPELAGTASGMMNSGSGLAAVLSPLLSGLVIDRTGNWDLPFLGSMLLMLLGVGLSFRMQPHIRLNMAEPD